MGETTKFERTVKIKSTIGDILMSAPGMILMFCAAMGILLWLAT